MRLGESVCCTTFGFVSLAEPISDSVWEISANNHLYHVVSGCAITMDTGNLTLDVAAGTIVHNGTEVAVTAQTNAVTLSADGTNGRWAWIGLDSTGTAALVSGTPASDPAVPELGDNVALMLVLVDAGLTIASNASYQIDKRIPGPVPGVGVRTLSQMAFFGGDF